MNCCHKNNSNNNQHDNKHNHKSIFSHMWMMALCCGAPVILLLLLPVLGSKLNGVRGVLSGIIPFICPIMMFGMFFMMMRKDKNSGNTDKLNDTK